MIEIIERDIALLKQRLLYANLSETRLINKQIEIKEKELGKCKNNQNVKLFNWKQVL